MKKEYVTFVRTFKDLPEGREIQIIVRDLTPGPRKYDAKNVKAVVASSPDRIPEGDTLWLRSTVGVLNPSPWAIKVVEELPEYVSGGPYTDILGEG